tara:strand:+ start:12994 stop:13572 length:579 start_codon:yes stop_codon:yes gene_type:complete
MSHLVYIVSCSGPNPAKASKEKLFLDYEEAEAHAAERSRDDKPAKFSVYPMVMEELRDPKPDSKLHHGRSRHRIKDNPLEKRFADMWEKLNGFDPGRGILSYLLANDNNRPDDVNERDAEVAATVIQWLGSPVGMGFVRDVLQLDKMRDALRYLKESMDATADSAPPGSRGYIRDNARQVKRVINILDNMNG